MKKVITKEEFIRLSNLTKLKVNPTPIIINYFFTKVDDYEEVDEDCDCEDCCDYSCKDCYLDEDCDCDECNSCSSDYSDDDDDEYDEEHQDDPYFDLLEGIAEGLGGDDTIKDFIYDVINEDSSIPASVISSFIDYWFDETVTPAQIAGYKANWTKLTK